MRNPLKTSVKTKEIPYGVRSTGWLRNQRPASSIFPHKSLVINGVNAPYEAKLAQPCGTSSKSGRWKEEEPFLLSPPWSPGQQREIDPETGLFFEFDGGRTLPYRPDPARGALGASKNRVVKKTRSMPLISTASRPLRLFLPPPFLRSDPPVDSHPTPGHPFTQLHPAGVKPWSAGSRKSCPEPG